MTAQTFLDSLRLNLARMEVAPTDKVIEEIIFALSSDLDTPQALASLRNWITATENGGVGGSAGELGRVIDALLGIAL